MGQKLEDIFFTAVVIIVFLLHEIKEATIGRLLR